MLLCNSVIIIIDFLLKIIFFTDIFGTLSIMLMSDILCSKKTSALKFCNKYPLAPQKCHFYKDSVFVIAFFSLISHYVLTLILLSNFSSGFEHTMLLSTLDLPIVLHTVFFYPKTQSINIKVTSGNCFACRRCCLAYFLLNFVDIECFINKHHNGLGKAISTCKLIFLHNSLIRHLLVIVL